MQPILVVYATREGHTRHIAEHIVANLKAQGIAGELQDAAQSRGMMTLTAFEASIVCASVHRGQHEREIVDFVKRNRTQLGQMPAAFISVSLSEAGVEDASAPPERRQQAAADVEKMIDDFMTETGWHPERVKAVAGALLYSKYNFVLRFIMKRIAQKAGGDTDTTRDHEYTDWTSLDQFVSQMVAALGVEDRPAESAATA